ncbi:MAG: flippase-like domain-containing protein [Proteobacteria bacterium]|nr:flippase-like domain-containing protein [Pseudomonadota bacterium]
MSDAADSRAEPVAASQRATPAWRDWRVWLSVAITVLCLWLAARDVPFEDLRQALADVKLGWLIAGSVPAYVASIYFRALRWRHLTEPLGAIPMPALFRATSIGFLVNNLVPLRIGEFVRSWYLARESGCSLAAVVGTVVVERVLDTITVLLIAVGGLAYVGRSSNAGGMLELGATLLLPVALVPLVGLVVLRVAPEPVIALIHGLARPLPTRWADRIEGLVRGFANGLGALRGGSHLFWIALHSVSIWLICSVIPLWVAFAAFGLELGTWTETLATAWIMLAALGVAVAIPSAPGFVGPYQLAFVEVLERFGVDGATALAMGALVWFVFWISFVGNGVAVLRFGGISLAEITRAPGKDPTTARR